MNRFSQTRNRLLSANLFVPDDKDVQTHDAPPTTGPEYVESAKRAARTEAPQHLAAVSASCAYGCVDWYLYPETKHEHAAT